jgi:hypothetical protein
VSTSGSKRQAHRSLLPASAGFFLGLFFDPEDEGNMFLRNVGTVSPDYTALQARIPYSSQSSLRESEIQQFLQFFYSSLKNSNSHKHISPLKTGDDSL